MKPEQQGRPEPAPPTSLINMLETHRYIFLHKFQGH